MSSYDAIIFDLDGTLLNSRQDLAERVNATLRQLGYPERDYDHICNSVGVGDGHRTFVELMLPEGASLDEMKAFGMLFSQLAETYEGVHTRPYEGITEMVAKLASRGLKLAVFSNRTTESVRYMLGVVVPGLFETIEGVGDEVPRKPDPTGLLRTAEILGVAPARTLYVGDSPGDIIAAQRAGMRSAAVTWGYKPITELVLCDPDYVVSAPREIVTLAMR